MSTPLEKLSALVNGGKPLSEEDVRKLEQQDAEAVKAIDTVLKFVAAMPGVEADIFAMQELVESCAEELRAQIRDMAEGD